MDNESKDSLISTVGIFESKAMAILPTRANYEESAASVLADLKKGEKEKRSSFVWMHQDKFYAIAFMATNDANQSNELTIMAFKNAFNALKQLNPKQMTTTVWSWLSMFIVDACQEYHDLHSSPPSGNPRTDPSADGSAQMDWETTIILGVQRVKRCLQQLPLEQQKVFLLRHQFQLSYDQIGVVLNQPPDTVMAWLFRARVQIVKCLGRG